MHQALLGIACNIQTRLSASGFGINRLCRRLFIGNYILGSDIQNCLFALAFGSIRGRRGLWRGNRLFGRNTQNRLNGKVLCALWGGLRGQGERLQKYQLSGQSGAVNRGRLCNAGAFQKVLFPGTIRIGQTLGGQNGVGKALRQLIPLPEIQQTSGGEQGITMLKSGH